MDSENKQGISILIVDDHQMMIDGLISFFLEEENFTIIGSAQSASQALKLVAITPPDIVLADINLPDMTGIELTKEIKQIKPEVQVIALTMHNERSLIQKMIEAGASGYVIKDSSIAELTEAIKVVSEGGNYLSKEAQKSFFSQGEHAEQVTGDLQQFRVRLTAREMEVLGLITKELSNKEIANTLFISERTVETHRKNIFTKTKTKSIVGLIKYAIEHGQTQ